jgi:hypothetical protein
MVRKIILAISFTAVLAAGYGQQASLTLRGVTWNDDGHPLPGVHVAVRGAEGSGVQTVVSGEDGTFVIENLKPGSYQLTETKAGFVDSAATAIELAADKTPYVDLTLTPGLNPPQGGFVHRLFQKTERTLKRLF